VAILAHLQLVEAIEVRVAAAVEAALAEAQSIFHLLSLDHDQVGLQSAGLLERLENGHQVAWRRPHLVDRTDNLVKRRTGAELEHWLGFLLGTDPGIGRSEERRVGKEGRSRWSPEHST